MIRLKKYMNVYLKILLHTFSFIIVVQPALGQDLNDSAQDDDKGVIEVAKDTAAVASQLEEPDTLSQVQPEEPDTLSQAQPDSIDNSALMKKRIIYGITGAVPIYFLLSKDKGKDASVIKIGPPPDWPDN